MTTKEQRIAGTRIFLDEGTRYIATRPIRKRGDGEFTTVWIRKMEGPNWFDGTPEILLPLTYDQADEFLAAFNDGPTTLHGRVW